MLKHQHLPYMKIEPKINEQLWDLCQSILQCLHKHPRVCCSSSNDIVSCSFCYCFLNSMRKNKHISQNSSDLDTILQQIASPHFTLKSSTDISEPIFQTAHYEKRWFYSVTAGYAVKLSIFVRVNTNATYYAH